MLQQIFGLLWFSQGISLGVGLLDHMVVLFLVFKGISILGFSGGSDDKNSPATQETLFRSLCQDDPLKKEMETHSSTLAWKIPLTKKPGRLQSMGSQRVGHD